MSAEQIIKAGTDLLTARHGELITLYAASDEATGGEYLLEEAALIEIELKNRGYQMKWQKD